MPQYADIGKVPKDLLLGNPKSGAFSFEPKLTWTSTTANGVTFAVTGVRKVDKVDGTIKVAYATKKYSADTTVDPSGKVVLNAALSELAKGVKLSASAVLPDPSSAKLTVDYAPCREFGIRGTTTLTSAPVVDLVATAEWKGVLVGGETGYDTAKAAVTKYNVALGYNAADFQVSGHLVDRASTFKATYAHSVNATTTLGGEVTRKLADGDTSFALGMAKKLSSGALAKLKFDNTGLLSALYETKLASGEKVAGSLQLQSTDLSKAPKYGFAIDLS